MTGSTLSQRAARRRGEFHHADGDRRVALALDAHRHLNNSGSGRASLKIKGGRQHDRNASLAL